jgi:hypothetical protein
MQEELKKELKETISSLRKAVKTIVVESNKQKVSTNIIEVCGFYKEIYEALGLITEMTDII